jgi:hydroxymethylbilane synthase
VSKALANAAPEVEVRLVPIRTGGDEAREGQARAPAGDKSRFVKEIEEALLRGEIDLAVHSAKDVPGELPPELAIVGVPERADPADALCGVATLAELPEGAVVGTASLRRRAQLLAERPDLDVRELRGNVDTRLDKLAAGEYEAIVLAAAGLARLGRDPDGRLPEAVMTPAAGQGCLALEARADDERSVELGGNLVHHDSLVRLTAERALVAGIDASCRTPVGAHAVLEHGELTLTAFVGMPDGSTWIRDALTRAADEPGDVGRAAAERLLVAGAGEMLAAAEREVPER